MPLQKIVAIGGGKVGRLDRTARTTRIDREIVGLSGKRAPRLLFVPTASAGCDKHCAAIYNQFSKRLGCKVDIMLLINTDPDRISIRDRMARADIIYVGEGNTLRMMRTWRRYGVDQEFRTARERGAVLCGASAGSIAWFSSGNSDSYKSARNPKKLICVKGLGFIDALLCPHYDAENHRKPSLREMMKKRRGVAIALDECSALVIHGDAYRVVASIPGRNAYRTYWKNNTYVEERLAPSKVFSPLMRLLVQPG